MAGWIKTYRAIQDHWIFSDAEKLRAWMIILFTVNFEDKKQMIEGEIIECKRGQSILSLNSWAEKFGRKWSIQKVRTFFNLLKKDKMITTEGLRKTTRLTVCKYDTYQDEQQRDNIEITHRQQGDNKEITTTKECKELEEVKNYKKYLSVWEIFPYKTDFKKVLNLFEEKFRPNTPAQKIEWLDIYEKAIRLDGYSSEKIVELISWAREDHFWVSNLMSLSSLRKKGKSGIKKIDSINAKFLSIKAPVENKKDDVINAGEFDPKEKY